MMGAAILSFLGRPFFLFSTTSPPSISRSGFLLPNARFLLMAAILSSLSLLVSSLHLMSLRMEMASFGLLGRGEIKGSPFVLFNWNLQSASHFLATLLTPCQVTCLKAPDQRWRRWLM